METIVRTAKELVAAESRIMDGELSRDDVLVSHRLARPSFMDWDAIEEHMVRSLGLAGAGEGSGSMR